MTAPLVKVCGFTDATQAAEAAAAGVDLIGVVLAPSPRRVPLRTAEAIVRALPSPARSVAVLLDPTVETVEEVVRALAPDFIQLHGAETPSFCRGIATAVIKAFITDGSPAVVSSAAPFRNAVSYFHFDSGRGSGKAAPWEALAILNLPRPFILAGGITPDNAGRAVALLSPDGIDASTGVERSPGDKDLSLIRRLVAAVKGGRRS